MTIAGEWQQNGTLRAAIGTFIALMAAVGTIAATCWGSFNPVCRSLLYGVRAKTPLLMAPGRPTTDWGRCRSGLAAATSRAPLLRTATRSCWSWACRLSS
ncbi:hypothetical protein ACSNOI_13375 [Actinomadura kijaniata]|uniref:hypothetical protein n=1 Tax=Actinomadura kijaniata TaxID=46161 RepID=UPI003F1A4449